jgi:hypothetical protein
VLFHLTSPSEQRLKTIEFVTFRLLFDGISFALVFVLFILLSDNWNKAVFLTSEVRKEHREKEKREEGE